jgi:mono/diheme cytochrome c family protein
MTMEETDMLTEEKHSKAVTAILSAAVFTSVFLPLSLYGIAHEKMETDTLSQKEPEVTTGPKVKDEIKKTYSKPSPDLESGRKLYIRSCAVCHGKNGDGKGPISRHLNPPPKNFTDGVYKFRTTVSGNLPTDEDLFRVISNGLGGAYGMPGWDGLSQDERWQLVYYIKSFSDDFKEEGPEPPVELGPVPELSDKTLAQGKKLFIELGCVDCHGYSGKGDGKAAPTLKDKRGKRAFAYDMSHGYKMKSKRTMENIGKIIITGLDGTPMASYDGAVSGEDLWYLVQYVKSLALDEK